MKSNIIETTDHLNDEDEKLLMQIETIKKNVINYINPETIIDELKKIIEESEYFDFKSKRNSKYISKTKPLFVLSINKDLASDEKEYEFKSDRKNNIIDIRDYEFITDCVHEQIISKFSDFLIQNLTTDKFFELLKNNNIDLSSISKEQIRLIYFVTASIFGINIELEQNIIYLEYVV